MWPPMCGDYRTASPWLSRRPCARADVDSIPPFGFALSRSRSSRRGGDDEPARDRSTHRPVIASLSGPAATSGAEPEARGARRRGRPRDRASERRALVALLSNPRVPRHDHSLTRLRRIPRQGLGLQTEVGHALVGVTWRRAYNYHSRLAKC